MFLHYLPSKLSSTLTLIFSPLVRIRKLKDMLNDSVRWGFGPRLLIADEEATLPLLHGEATDDAPPPASRLPSRHADAMETDSDDKSTVIESPSPHPPYFTDEELSCIDIPSLPVHRPDARISDRRFKPSVRQSFSPGKLYRVRQAKIEVNGGESLPTSSSSSYEPTHEESIHLDHFIATCHEHLERLKTITPESLPPYNPRLQTKTHPQLLKQRLLPIGKFIVNYLPQAPKQDRGKLELLLCRRIAAEYWPLPVDESTAIRIHEMYRNVLFNEASQKADAEKPLDPGAGGDSPHTETGRDSQPRDRVPTHAEVQEVLHASKNASE
jgi:hypothetical protein